MQEIDDLMWLIMLSKDNEDKSLAELFNSKEIENFAHELNAKVGDIKKLYPITDNMDTVDDLLKNKDKLKAVMGEKLFRKYLAISVILQEKIGYLMSLSCNKEEIDEYKKVGGSMRIRLR